MMFGSPRYMFIGFLSFIMTGLSITSWSQTRNPIAESLSACENYVYISGESNVNQFSFRYNKAKISGKYNSSSSDTGSIEISIPIKDFRPSNPMMYGDFLILMKESEHPRIIVSFSKRNLQSKNADLQGNCPDIRITIAGITKTYKIKCAINKCANNLYLSGEETIKLSDFQLKSPEKMMGLVKVNNEITVNFGFIINFEASNQISATF